MSHYYDREGNPAYEVPNKSTGGMRATTVSDARKLNLSPSVTTVMAGAAKPALGPYVEKQILDAAISVKANGMAEVEWRQAVLRKSREHSKNAAAKGTKIHDALEHYYLTGKIKRGESPILRSKTEGGYYGWKEVLAPVIEALRSEFGDIKWTPERSFTHPLGFGGKVDMSYNGEDKQIVLDFKTKDTDDIKKMVAYDDHGIQTASYAVGLDIPNAIRYNLFISTQVPGLIKLTESVDFERDWGMFKSLLELWQWKNKYIPGVA